MSDPETDARLARAYRDLEDSIGKTKHLFVILEDVVERLLNEPLPKERLPSNNHFQSEASKVYEVLDEDVNATLELLYTVGDKVRALSRQYRAGLERPEPAKEAA
jgi:hypothetical protein